MGAEGVGELYSQLIFSVNLKLPTKIKAIKNKEKPDQVTKG